MMPVTSEAIDIALIRYVKMLDQVTSLAELEKIHDFANLLAKQLVEHNLHELADTVISAYIQEGENYET